MSVTRIFKYPVSGGGVATRITCHLKRILDIQLQDGDIMCWIETCEECPDKTIEILSVGTGWSMPSEFINKSSYIKTVQDDMGYVWHFYDVTGTYDGHIDTSDGSTYA